MSTTPPELEQLLSAATAYGDTRATQAAAAQKFVDDQVLEQLRTTMQATLDQRDATIADLTQQLTALRPPAEFPGDPGRGRFLLGWAEGPKTGGVDRGAVSAGEKWSGVPIAVRSCYASNGPDVPKLAAVLAAGMLPLQTFKFLNHTRADVAGGKADAEIDTAAAAVAQLPGPVWLGYFREPEDDITTTTDQAAYRAATRRIVKRFRAAGATNVAWMPVFMAPYTFVPAYGAKRDWRAWHADWDPKTGWSDDPTMDLLGLDVYDPLPGATTHHLVSEMIGGSLAVVAKSGAPARPVVLPEFGWSNRAKGRPSWQTVADDSLQAFDDFDVRAACGWDNSKDVGRYSFDKTGDPDGTKLPAWRSLASHAVPLTPSIPTTAARS